MRKTPQKELKKGVYFYNKYSDLELKLPFRSRIIVF
jgi:hypothetical protein